MGVSGIHPAEKKKTFLLRQQQQHHLAHVHRFPSLERGEDVYELDASSVMSDDLMIPSNE